LVGATKGKGIEVDVTARPLSGLNINAGYSFNETKVSKSSGTSGSLVVGDLLARTPKHTANLSFFYTLPSGALKGLHLEPSEIILVTAQEVGMMTIYGQLLHQQLLIQNQTQLIP